MHEAAFAVPGDLSAPTGGYAYARRLLEFLPRHGVRPIHIALPAGFPFPCSVDLDETALLFARLSGRSPLLVDGLAYGALPPATISAARGRSVVALVHHPLGYEAGLAPARAAGLVASERAALALADRVIATSPFTAGLLSERFDVPAGKLVVAVPGTEPGRRVEPRPGAYAHLLAVGAATPRKGYDVLVAALTELADLDWRLTIVGALDRDPAYADALAARVARSGLGARIRLAGAVDQAELQRLYAQADAVVSASLFEGYGMALAEALARGLPLVAASGGAASETAPDAASLKVPPGDVAALAGAIRCIVVEPARRRTLAEAAWAAGRALPDWDDTAAIVARVLREAGRD